MERAMLRGAFWGLATILLTVAVVEATVLFDGGTWTEALLLGIGIGVGSAISPALIAFLTHPGAKSAVDRIQPWIERSGPRILAGMLVGVAMGAVAGLVGAVVCGLLGIRFTDPPAFVRRAAVLQRAGLFAVSGMSAAAFAGSVLGGVLAPSVYTGNEWRLAFLKHCAWVSILAAIAGAWIGTGAGLLLARAIEWKREFEPDPHDEPLIGFAVGLAAGVASAITLHLWRRDR